MKRTIKEVYDLILEKRDNALNDEKANENDRFYLREITGAINAYEDVLCLIDSSHLLEEDKPIKGNGLEALEKLGTEYGVVNVDRMSVTHIYALKPYRIIEQELKEGEEAKQMIRFLKKYFHKNGFDELVPDGNFYNLPLEEQEVFRRMFEWKNLKSAK